MEEWIRSIIEWENILKHISIYIKMVNSIGL